MMAGYTFHIVLMCGSREWDRPDIIERAIGKLVAQWGTMRFIVVAGGCRGADVMAEKAAKAAGVHVARVDALWDSYKTSAGPIRNSMMLAIEPDLVVAFHPDLTRSSGTIDTVRRAQKAGIKTIVVTGRRKETKA